MWIEGKKERDVGVKNWLMKNIMMRYENDRWLKRLFIQAHLKITNEDV